MIVEPFLSTVVMQRTKTYEPLAADRHAGIRQLLRLAAMCAADSDRANAHAWKAELRVALREACDLARREDLHAEQVIVILKQSWRCVAETGALRHKDAEDALSDVVTECIKEYYRSAEPQ